MCWNHKLNPTKCLVRRFTEQIGKNSESYQIFGGNLQFVNVYKDLGVNVGVKIRFHGHVKHWVGQPAQPHTQFGKRVSSSRGWFICQWTVCTLYNNLILILFFQEI